METYIEACHRLIPEGYNTSYKLLNKLKQEFDEGKRRWQAKMDSLTGQLTTAVKRGEFIQVGEELHNGSWYNVYEVNPYPPDRRTMKQKVFDFIKASKEPVTIMDVHKATKIELYSLKSAISALQQAGVINPLGLVGHLRLYEFNTGHRVRKAKRKGRLPDFGPAPKPKGRPRLVIRPAAEIKRAGPKPKTPDVLDAMFATIRKNNGG